MAFTPLTKTTPANPSDSGMSPGFHPITKEAATKNAPAALSASSSILNFMKGVGGNVASAAGEQIDQGAEDLNKNAAVQESGAGAGTKIKSEALTGLHLAGDTANAIFAPFTGAIKSISDAASDQGIVQKFATHPAIAGLLDKSSAVSKKLSDWAAAHPEVSRSLGDIVSVASLAGGGEGAGAGVARAGEAAARGSEGLQSAVQAAKDAAGAVMKSSKDARFEKVTDLLKPKVVAPEKADQSAWEILAPKATPNTEELYRNSGAVGKAGLFKGAKFQPLAQDQKMIEAVRPLMETGELKPGMDPADIHATIGRKVAQMDSDVKNFVADNNAPIEETTLDEALNSKKKDNNILFKSDPNTERAYDEVINEFKKYVRTGQKVVDADTGAETMQPHDPGSGPTTNFTDTKSVFEARRGFDKLIEKKFPQAFARTATGDLTPSNNAIVTALRDVRNAANDMVSDTLPANNPYKPMLKTESDLINAMNRADENAIGTVGKSKISQFLKRHPALKKLAHYGLAGVGLGAGGVIGETAIHEL